jgi:hypothetical protein
VKVGDLVKTKVSILNNRIVKDKLGIVVSLRPFVLEGHPVNIVGIRLSDEPRVWAYKEKDLEMLSESR